jgi:taurine transport system permease protein
MAKFRGKKRRRDAGRTDVVARIVQRAGIKTAFPFAVVLVLWWIVARAQIFPEAFFIGPGAVVGKFIEMTRKGILPDYLEDSISRLALGGVLGIVIGLPVGYLIGLNRYVRRACWPVLLFFQAIADIAWLPLLIIWFGFSLTSVNFVIIYTVVFPVIVSIVSGVDVGMIILGVLWYALDSLILAPLERETVERWGLVRQIGRKG